MTSRARATAAASRAFVSYSWGSTAGLLRMLVIATRSPASCSTMSPQTFSAATTPIRNGGAPRLAGAAASSAGARGTSPRVLARAAQPEQVQAVPGDEKVTPGEPHALERSQQAGVHRLHRPAPLADHVIVVTIGEAEMRGPVHLDLLDKAGRVEAGQGPVDGHEAEVAAEPLRLFPDRLAGGEMAAHSQGLENGQTLGGDAPSRPPEQRDKPRVG